MLGSDYQIPKQFYKQCLKAKSYSQRDMQRERERERERERDTEREREIEIYRVFHRKGYQNFYNIYLKIKRPSKLLGTLSQDSNNFKM